jgi:hypothetical protein
MALPRTQRLAAVTAAVVAIALSACGDADSTVTPTATTVPIIDTVPTSSPTSTGGSTATSAPASGIADYVFRDGKVVSGDSRLTVKVGDDVVIRVLSDVAEEVHVHTYDLMVDLEPGVAGEVAFKADIPGVHEVELEHSGLHLLSLEVQ